MKERSSRRLTVLTVLVLGTLVLSACATRSVNQILADPSRYRNREVRVSGSVGESYSFADRGVYRIDDKSGQLWVVSDRGVPRKGARVTVKGTIREGFNLGTLGDRISLPAGIGSGIRAPERAEPLRPAAVRGFRWSGVAVL